MASVVLRNIVKRFGKTEVVHGIDLEIGDKEFVVLVGPSGCGKSTILRLIAGFIGSPPMNLVPAKTGFAEQGFYLSFNDSLQIPVPPKPEFQLKDGTEVIMGLRTEDIIPADGAENHSNHYTVPGVVAVVEPLGSETNIHMDLQGIRVIGKCDGRRPVRVGETLKMALNLKHLHIFDAQTTQSVY